MKQLQLDIPDDLGQFLDSLKAEDGFVSETDFILRLLREARRKRAERRLEELILEGMEGPFVELDDEEWKSIEAEAIREAHGTPASP